MYSGKRHVVKQNPRETKIDPTKTSHDPKHISDLFSASTIKLLQPFLLLLAELSSPPLRYLQVNGGFMRQVVEIHCFTPCFGDGLFNLRSFMPFIEWRYGDDLWSRVYCSIKSGFIILSVNAVSCILCIPGADTSVDVTWPYTWNKHQVIIVAEGFDGSPVMMRRAVCKSVGCKISVKSIKSSSQDVLLVSFFHKKSNKDAVVWCVSDSRYAVRL